MTLYDFYSLSREEQKQMVQDKGVQLVSRNMYDVQLRLYELGGLYVECYYDKATEVILPLRSFRTPDLLDPYLDEIDISPLLQ